MHIYRSKFNQRRCVQVSDQFYDLRLASSQAAAELVALLYHAAQLVAELLSYLFGVGRPPLQVEMEAHKVVA
jgi:hypothetical protein